MAEATFKKQGILELPGLYVDASRAMVPEAPFTIKVSAGRGADWEDSYTKDFTVQELAEYIMFLEKVLETF
jgi:hypothetical protein